MNICNILAGTDHFSVAGEADSAASAIDVAQSVPWDIAIVSAAFNDRDGCTRLDVCENINGWIV
jgi:DNA-binding NarL/FixJ family response regulator